MDAQGPNDVGEVVVIGEHRAAVAVATEGLRGEEARRRKVPRCFRPPGGCRSDARRFSVVIDQNTLLEREHQGDEH